MDLVSHMLGMLDAAILNAGHTFFETTARSVGPLYTAFLTTLLVLVGINAALNVYRISMRDAFQLAIRIVVVLMFGLSWTNFATLYDAMSTGTANLALSFFGVAKADALGFSLLLHASQFVPITLWGLMLLVVEHVSLKEIGRVRGASRMTPPEEVS